MKDSDVNSCLEQLILEGRGADLSGKELQVTGTIKYLEAQKIISLIMENKCITTLETGVAYGASTVAICYALCQNSAGDQKYKHYGIDPCQYTDYNGAAIAALRRCRLDNLFELLDGPSHTMLPGLLQSGVKVDLAFIDGWHTFDYTLVDVFYTDKLLRPGGLLIMHDMFMPSKQKVWGWLRKHRQYKVIPFSKRPYIRDLASSFIWLLRGRKDVARSRLEGIGGLLIAEKLNDWEPEYDFYGKF